MCKCLKSHLKSMLKYCILMLIPALLFLFYYIVTYMPITIPKKEAAKINISNYVPNMYSAILTYITTPDKYNVSYYSKEIIKAYNFTISNNNENLFYVYNYDGKKNGALTFISSINVSDKSITALSTNNLYEDTSPDEILLSSSTSWRISEKEKAYLTGKNLSIDTIAGTFNDCLEITIIKNINNWEKEYSTVYVAPVVGDIMKKTGTSMRNQNKVFELYNYSIPGHKPATIEDVDSFLNYSLPLLSSPLDSNTYKDEKLGISLNIPNDWIGSVKVDNTIWSDNIEHSTSFILSAGNNLYHKIFSIHMLKKGYGKDFVDADPDLKYIGEYNGRTLIYTTANYDTKETGYDDTLYRKLNDMINDTNGIIKSISKL